MNKAPAIKLIDNIISLLNEQGINSPNHLYYCESIILEFQKLKHAIINNSNELNGLIEWCIWFSPRIIFDGINNKIILDKLEELNETLKNNI